MPVSLSPSVVSGQQVGLLGGPLFILYKILGVYRLTDTTELSGLTEVSGEGLQELSTELNPVFWLEGNDADFNEINTFHGIDRDGVIRPYRWNPQQMRGQPIGNYLIDDDLLNLYRDYFTSLPTTDHTEKVRDLVFQSYHQGQTLLTANQKFYSDLFRGFEESHPTLKRMTWFRPDEKDFRDFSQPLLRKEVAKSDDGQCPVFALINGRREALFKQGKNCVTRNGKVINLDQVLLPSVWNRSILQDAYWKVAAYVAGPAEEKYLRDLRPSYKYHGVTPAWVIPRMSATIVNPQQVKSIHGLGLEVGDILDHDRGHLVDLLQSRDSVLKIGLRELRKKFQEEKDRKTNQFHASDPGPDIRRYERELYVKMKHELGRRRKDFKTRRGDDLSRLRELENYLHPPIKGEGSPHVPQERFHNVVSFLNLYGIKAISTIYREYQFDRKTIIKLT